MPLFEHPAIQARQRTQVPLERQQRHPLGVAGDARVEVDDHGEALAHRGFSTIRRGQGEVHTASS